jgi:hypothetical protein
LATNEEHTLEDRMAHIMVCTPMYGGMTTGVYVQSLLNMVGQFSAMGHKVSCAFMFNESLIQRARNNMAHQFLKSEADYLFWIDADIKFRAEDALRMLMADKDVIGGIYPKKEINWQSVREAAGAGQEKLQNFTGSFVVNLINATNGNVVVRQDQPCEVAALGTGFLLIKRQVFEKLKKKVKTYKNDMTALPYGEEIHEFFGVPIDKESGRLLSEDYDFCQKWRKAGGKVYAAPWCQLGHMGSYLFEGTLVPTTEPTTMESDNGSGMARNSGKATGVGSRSTKGTVGRKDGPGGNKNSGPGRKRGG